MRIEREQLAEIFTLVSSGSMRSGGHEHAGTAKGGDKTSRLEGPRLRMILDAGSASSAKLAELLSELSVLNRRLGGPGTDFVLHDCRTWNVASLRAKVGGEHGEAAKKSSERSFVEIYVVPTSAEADARFAASHWDRFTASLFMVLRLDAGQANYFKLADSVTRDHASYVLAADAVIRATRMTPNGGTKAAVPQDGTNSVDGVNQQLQKIEDLRRRLERENSLVLELAPAVEPVDESEAAIEAVLPPTAGRRRIKLAIAAAAAILIACGVWLFPRNFNSAAAQPQTPAAPSKEGNAATPQHVDAEATTAMATGR
jgi:hypothetical protein